MNTPKDIKAARSPLFIRIHGGIFDDISNQMDGMNILITDDEAKRLRKVLKRVLRHGR